MKSKDIFWGVVLSGIGTIFLLRNLGWISFNWYVFRSLWPVLLIILGISLLPLKSVARLLLSLLAIILSLVYISVNPVEDRHFFRFPFGITWKWDDEKDNKEDYDHLVDSSFQIAIGTDVHRAILELDAMAGHYIAGVSENDFFRIETTDVLTRYLIRTEHAGNSVIFRIRPREKKFIQRGEHFITRIYFPASVVWDINMDAGAARVNFDLSVLRIDRLEINGGASDIHIKVGELYPETHIRINAGAAQVTIEVPEKSGCEVKSNTVLASKDFEDFRALGGGLYRTTNFSVARNKIFVQIDAAVSSLKVNRY